MELAQPRSQRQPRHLLSWEDQIPGVCPLSSGRKAGEMIDIDSGKASGNTAGCGFTPSDNDKAWDWAAGPGMSLRKIWTPIGSTSRTPNAILSMPASNSRSGTCHWIAVRRRQSRTWKPRFATARTWRVAPSGRSQRTGGKCGSPARTKGLPRGSRRCSTRARFAWAWVNDAASRALCRLGGIPADLACGWEKRLCINGVA